MTQDVRRLRVITVLPVKNLLKLFCCLRNDTVIRDNVNNMFLMFSECFHQRALCAAKCFSAAGRHAHKINIRILCNILKCLLLNVRARLLQECLIRIYAERFQLSVQFFKTRCKIAFQCRSVDITAKMLGIQRIRVNKAGITITDKI